MITGLTVTFDQAVTLDATAFQLSGQNGAGVGTILQWNNLSGDGRTWVLSFTGPPVLNHSLADGVYDLTIIPAAVHAAGNPAVTMTSNYGVTLYRLFGDIDGNMTVNNGDAFQFNKSYLKNAGDPAYQPSLDWGGDGTVNNGDAFQFNKRYLKKLTAQSGPPIDGSWQKIFDDEFDSSTLNPLWHTAQWWDRNVTTLGEGDEAYDASGVTTSNGQLHLTARRDTSDGNPYVSGMVMTGGYADDSTVPKFSFLHGYLEVRAKLPAGQGFWPAIWMMPASYNDGNGELDVMESLGGSPSRVYFTLHRNAKFQQKNFDVLPDTVSGFHTYGVDWEADHVSWFVDGVEVARMTNPALICPEAMYPILNLAVGGDWGGPPNSSTTFPSSMDVDYVRIWQKN
jgi:hypothetical protein